MGLLPIHVLEGDTKRIEPLVKTEVPLPSTSKSELALTPEAQLNIDRHRQEIAAIMNGEDNRMLMVLGPCSLDFDYEDDIFALVDQISMLQEQYSSTMKFVLRLPSEKPRSMNKPDDWTGAIHDPLKQGNNDHALGIQMVRRVYSDIAERGVALSAEMLSETVWNQVEDTMSMGWVGARTIADQAKAHFVGAQPMPFALKNDTTGSIKTALGAMRFASNPKQVTIPARDTNRPITINSQGNTNLAIIHRGGDTGPNYSLEDIRNTANQIQSDPHLSGLKPNVIVDCAHGNCIVNGKKSIDGQIHALETTIQNLRSEDSNLITGVMMEVSTTDRTSTDPVVPIAHIERQLAKLHATLLQTRGEDRINLLRMKVDIANTHLVHTLGHIEQDGIKEIDGIEAIVRENFEQKCKSIGLDPRLGLGVMNLLLEKKLIGREGLNGTERAITGVLKRRQDATDQIGRLKAELGLNALDTSREEAIHDSILAIGREIGVDPNLISSTVQLIMDVTKNRHNEIRANL